MKSVRISGVTIIKCEEILVASHMVHMASLVDDLVVIIQPSSDCTLLYARDIARRLDVPCRIIEDEPEKLGWEFSLALAAKEAKHDWLFALTCDESYVGVPLPELAQRGVVAKAHVVWIPRLHAVGCTPGTWFKTETYVPQARLVRKDAIDPKFPYDLHLGWNQMFYSRRGHKVPPETARILEYKSPSRHYTGQLFTHARGALTEKVQCEERMAKRDRKLGKLIYKTFWR